jgi:hypothetical protein
MDWTCYVDWGTLKNRKVLVSYYLHSCYTDLPINYSPLYYHRDTNKLLNTVCSTLDIAFCNCDFYM